MLNLIKIILIVISSLTSNEVFAIRSKRPKIKLNLPEPDPNSDLSGDPKITLFAIVLQLSFYVFAIYMDSLEEKKKKVNETDVDDIEN